MNHAVYNKKNVQCNGFKRNPLLTILLLFFLLGLVQPVCADDEEWPKEYQIPEGRVVIYQPQLESFEENKLTARSAVSVRKKGAEPVFGTMWFAARVATDREERLVTLLDIDITNVKFPTAPDPADVEAFSKILNDRITKSEITISLDRLLTMMELVETKKKESRNLKTDPPKIIVVNHPAVLVSIDGKPELRKIEGSSLMRVINTPFFIVLDTTSKKYYLKGGDNWFVSSDMKGAWKNTPQPPASVLEASKNEFEGLEESDTEKKASDRMPEIIVSSTPAELITTEGEPSYKTISDTNLLYVSNTESDLFMEINSQKYFVLISGRWYSSKSLNGKWAFVPADNLPADFAQIPESSDKADVLASVAGTTQAKEAVLDSYIPQTATVDRNQKIEAAVEYDGEPKFENIEKTSMQYAVNTPESVIKVGGFYYLCQNAVWYISDSPSGPWAVAVNVPQEVYTIPPSSPAYNVTYVHVYDHTPKVVYVGYYPGYYGSYVYGGTVVYGTGYYYPYWYGTVYYPRPVTWGVSVRYTSYGGWGVRVGYGAPIGWWGRTAHRSYWRNKRYDNYKDRRDFRRDAYNDRRDRQDQRYQDRKDRNDNRRDGMKDRQDRQDRQARQDRRGDGGKRDRVDNRRDGQQSRPDKRGEAQRDRRDTRSKDRTATSRTNRNNVYSDRQGNVHRKTDQGWQQRGSGGWSRPESASRPSSARSGYNRSDLNRQSQARSRGSNRSSNFQQNRSSSRSSHSRSGGGGRSGGSRGGGGRR